MADNEKFEIQISTPADTQGIETATEKLGEAKVAAEQLDATTSEPKVDTKSIEEATALYAEAVGRAQSLDESFVALNVNDEKAAEAISTIAQLKEGLDEVESKTITVDIQTNLPEVTEQAQETGESLRTTAADFGTIVSGGKDAAGILSTLVFGTANFRVLGKLIKGAGDAAHGGATGLKGFISMFAVGAKVVSNLSPWLKAAAVIGTVTAAAVGVYAKKSKEAEKNAKDLQEQMDAADSENFKKQLEAAASTKADFSQVTDSIKSITDEFDKAAEAAARLQAAEDKLVDSQLALELSKLGLARQQEINAAGGDKKKEAAINLDFDNRENDARRRADDRKTQAEVDRANQKASVVAQKISSLSLEQNSLNNVREGASDRLQAAQEGIKKSGVRSDRARLDQQLAPFEKEIKETGGITGVDRNKEFERLKAQRDQASDSSFQKEQQELELKKSLSEEDRKRLAAIKELEGAQKANVQAATDWAEKSKELADTLAKLRVDEGVAKAEIEIARTSRLISEADATRKNAENVGRGTDLEKQRQDDIRGQREARFRLDSGEETVRISQEARSGLVPQQGTVSAGVLEKIKEIENGLKKDGDQGGEMDALVKALLSLADNATAKSQRQDTVIRNATLEIRRLEGLIKNNQPAN